MLRRAKSKGDACQIRQDVDAVSRWVAQHRQRGDRGYCAVVKVISPSTVAKKVTQPPPAARNR